MEVARERGMCTGFHSRGLSQFWGYRAKPLSVQSSGSRERKKGVDMFGLRAIRSVGAVLGASSLLLISGCPAETVVEPQHAWVFGGSGYSSANTVQQTADGGYILAGGSQTWNSGIDGGDIQVLKADQDGNVVWSKTFVGSDYGYATTVREDPDGGYILGGTSGWTGEHCGHMYVVKVDGTGSVVWSKMWADSSADVVADIIQMGAQCQPSQMRTFPTSRRTAW